MLKVLRSSRVGSMVLVLVIVEMSMVTLMMRAAGVVLVRVRSLELDLVGAVHALVAPSLSAVMRWRRLTTIRFDGADTCDSREEVEKGAFNAEICREDGAPKL